MRVDFYTDHLDRYLSRAEQQLKTLADKWCEAEWGKKADAYGYTGVKGTLKASEYRRDCQNGKGRVYASVLKAGEEMVTFYLHESPKA